MTLCFIPNALIPNYSDPDWDLNDGTKTPRLGMIWDTPFGSGNSWWQMDLGFGIMTWSGNWRLGNMHSRKRHGANGVISFSPFLVKDNSFESKISVSKVLKFLVNERAVCRNSREYICTNLILFLLNIFCCLVLSSCLSNDDPFFHWNLIFEVRFRNEFYKFVQDKRSHDIFNHTNWFRYRV